MPGKIRLRLGTKLLISLVLLVGLVIAFLNTSAILLVREDREAYIFQAKSAESILAGREFAGIVRNTLAGLRAAMAAVDPRKPLTPAETSALRATLNHYPEIVSFSLGMASEETGEFSRVHENAQEQLGRSFAIAPELIRAFLPELLRNGYSVVGLSEAPDGFFIGVLTADAGLRSPAGLPIALGVIPLSALAGDLRGLHLTIGNDSGLPLFDSDPARLFSGLDLNQDALFKFARVNRQANGTLSFEQEGVRYLGSYYRPGYGLIALTRENWDEAMRGTYVLTERMILLGVMAVAASIIFAILFSSSLTAPINRLYEATRVVSQGQFDVDLEIHTRDEIGALTESFNSMSSKIAELFKESVEKVKLENEIDIAATVQRTLIPAPVVDESKFQIRAHYQSATQCGGDWWGYFVSGHRLCIGIGDATGHGLPSALITTTAHSCFSFLKKAADQSAAFELSPANALSFAHRAVYEASKGQIQMTFFLAVIDLRTGEMNYASAGHNPPWIIGADGKIASLVNPGSQLGESADIPPHNEKKVQLKPGDMLLLYTDGLIEAQNTEGMQLSRKSMRNAILAGSSDPLEGVVERLLNLFKGHTGGAPLMDDVTVVVTKFIPSRGVNAEA